MKKVLAILALSAMTLMLVGCDKSADDYSKEGMEFYKSRDYDQAEAYLNKATSMKPNNKEFASNYGMILIQQGRIDDAINQFSKLITDKTSASAKKDNKLGYRGLGMAYIQNKNYTKAIEYFDKALEITENPSWDTDIKYYKANACELSGDVDMAIQMYSDILEKDTENPNAYKARANLYRDREEYALALADYNLALLYDKESFEIYIGLAACYLESGHKEEADEALFLASLLDIKTDEDKFYLGVVHYYQENFDSAKSEMEYALASGFNGAYFYLAEITLMQEDYAKAQEYFTKYSESTVVESPTVCNDVAVCAMMMEDYDSAAQWIKKGLSFPNSGVIKELKRNEIACLEGQGNLKDAYSKISLYITEYPDDEGAKKDYEFLKSRVGGFEDVPSNTQKTEAPATDAPKTEESKTGV